MSVSRFVLSASALLGLVLGSCSSTTLDGTWMRPGFAKARLEGSVLVVGVARDETVRRVYEDHVAANLGSRGVSALRSYEKVPGVLDKDSTDRVMAAARQAGARYLLSTAVIGEGIEQVVTQDPVVQTGGHYRGWYGSYYGVSYGGTAEVHTYKVYVAETSLVDVEADRVEWTARTRTTEPSNIESGTRELAEVILGALGEAGLVGAAK